MRRTVGLIIVILSTMSGSLSGQIHQPVRVSALDTVDVIGIACRTNNAEEAAGKGCIGKQWARLISEGLLKAIPHRADNNVIAVYTDYSSDKDGYYTYVLGAKVNPGTAAPGGMVRTNIKAGRFAVFTSDKGRVQEVLPATWKRIWEIPSSQPGGNRLYESDFEIYDQRAADSNFAQVDVFIRIH